MKLEDEAEVRVSRTRARSLSVIVVVERPSIRMSPVVGRSSNPNKYSNDDLPEPEGPVMAMNSRGMMARLMFRTSVIGTIPLRTFVTWRASISAPLMSRP